MLSSQWVGIALLLVVMGGLVYAFVRHGTKVKSADKPDGGYIDPGNFGDHSGSGGH